MAGANKIIWHFEANGSYSVKSGYKILLNEEIVLNMVVHSGKQRSAHHLVDFARIFLLEFNESSTLSKDCGVVVAALARRVNGVLSVENTELIALREGLRFAIDAGCPPSIAECDALKIVNGLKSLNPLAVNAPLFSNVLSFMSFARCGSCHYIFRCGNRVAHNLASHIFTRPSDIYWVESIPAFISSFVI
ncbi:hypothetical protein TorRG33x02_219320 [Trema orientale]|uniref:RNase H type-1 domain-containing protein n=1 Tax=Trema orientale TaxID=63057 RepID=A0A2P5E9X2_TREOI|nr:hypothetical protein TorRG33x02_219320 [Trema orientale]